MNAERFQWLATFKPNQIYLTRNEHACNYCSVQEWIENYSHDLFKDETPEVIQAMIAADTIWTLQIYPHTPIGFHRWSRATLEEVIDAAMEHFNSATTSTDGSKETK